VGEGIYRHPTMVRTMIKAVISTGMDCDAYKHPYSSLYASSRREWI
jgi:hypothetical protein